MGEVPQTGRPSGGFHRATFGRIAPEKQERVIAAAAREFADNGFASANTAAIAERAGISIGSLYKYFESKTHLYLEVVEHGLALIEEALGPILQSDTTLGEKIDLILDAVIESAETYPVMTRLYNRFTAEGDRDLVRRLATRIESVTAGAYAALLEGARREGILTTATDARLLAFFTDNLFLTLQFSLSAEYWRDRMAIYLGAELAGRRDELKKQLSAYIRRALGLTL